MAHPPSGGGVSIRGTGYYQTSRTHRAYYSRLHKPSEDATGAILLNALGGDADYWFLAGYYADGWLEGFAHYGIPCVAIEVHELWGNATMLTRIEAVKDYAQSDLGFAAGPVHLFGASMGSAAAYRYAMANPDHVASISTGMSIPDIQDIYDNNRGGLASSLSTAYGGRPADADNPALHPGDFDGIPILAAHSSDDPIGQSADVVSFCAAVEDGTDLALGAVGHTWIYMDCWAPGAFGTDGTVLPLDLDPFE